MSRGSSELVVLSEENPGPTESVNSLLQLRIVRGPLAPNENEAILSQYNQRIQPPWITMPEFLHWVQDSPEGPACHAIVESDSEGIVGHQCLFPFRANYRERRYVAAKSEYTFLREEFQTARVRGFEDVGKPTHLIGFQQLFQHCQSEGWGPFLISTTPALRRRGFYGFVRRNFPLWECLLVLRPIDAARETPSLQRWQRSCLLLGGAVQSAAWSPTAFFAPRAKGFQPVRMDDSPLPQRDGLLSFFGDTDSLRWRYSGDDYRRLGLDAQRADYLIYKEGTPKQYMRVCQWHLDSSALSLSRIAGLVQIAQRDGAMGVRWAIYGEDNAANRVLVDRLRRFGFLCVRRERVLLIKSQEEELLAPENWDLTDAMFSFHR